MSLCRYASFAKVAWPDATVKREPSKPLLTFSRSDAALALLGANMAREITEMLTLLVAETARNCISNHERGLALATAKLLVAMNSDNALEVDDTLNYQLIMENLVESGSLKIRSDNHKIFVCRSRSVQDGV